MGSDEIMVYLLFASVIACAGLLGLLLLDLIARIGSPGRGGVFRGWLGTYLSGLSGSWVQRRAIERIVIGQIATVVRQNLPLATGLTLSADSEIGWARLHLRRTSNLLAQGVSLSEALRLGFPDCSGLVLSMVAAGEQAGQLPAALEQAEQHLIEQARRRERLDVSVWAYLVCLMAMTILVVSGIMIAIIPKFEEIFGDYGAELPGLTMLLISVSRWFVAGQPPGWILLLAGVLIVAFFCVRPRRFPDPSLTTRIADWIRWHVPGLRRVEFGQGMSVMLRIIRLAASSGMGLASGARLAAELDVNAQLRGRMRRFADLLTVGMNLGAASETARLGRVATTALASGQRAGDVDAALRYAADYHDAIVSRWWIVLGNLAWPLCTLVMATLVGMVVLALFTPIVALINAAAG